MEQNLDLHIETVDGSEYDVRVIFADMVKYDIMRSRLKYPPRDESEFLFLALLAYAALVRTGQVNKNEHKPELWVETVAAVEPVGLEEDEESFRTESDN